MRKTSKKKERIVSKVIKSSKLEELEIKKIEENLKKKEQEKEFKAKKEKETEKKEEKQEQKKPEQPKKEEKRDIVEEKLEEWQDGVFVTEFSPVTDSSPVIRQDRKEAKAREEPLEQALAQVPSKEEKKEEKIYSASTIEKGYFKEIYTDTKEKYTGRDWSEDRPMEEIRGRSARFSEVSHARDGRREASMGRRMNLMEDGMLSMGKRDRGETIKYDMALNANQDEHMDGFAPEFEAKYKHRKKL